MTKNRVWVGMGFLGLGLQGVLQLFAAAAALAEVPVCMARGEELRVDNARAYQLKQSAPLGKAFRARISGRVTRIFPDRNNHEHFEIQLDQYDHEPKAVVEVVYSSDFGDMPTPDLGSVVEACGDFINAYATNNGYPPSPSGAIIHWVHRSTSPRHDGGYVLLDNVLYGNGPDKGKRRRR